VWVDGFAVAISKPADKELERMELRQLKDEQGRDVTTAERYAEVDAKHVADLSERIAHMPPSPSASAESTRIINRRPRS
jgi:hypothetical protein